jgi:hypothetical protein
MQKFNVTVVKTYEKDGEEKKTYPQVGKLIKFPAKDDKEESYLLELNMFPELRFAIFKDEPREKKEAIDL